MAAVKKFVQETDYKSWKTTFSLYEKVLEIKADSKTKTAAAKELKSLDKWYQTELPEILINRKEKHIIREELVKLMTWKLSRGKFRPRLVDLAGSNTENDVEKHSKEAFSKVEKGNLKGAIESLSKLKGIGPATASAVLAAGSPDKAAFMADEPTVAILGEGSLKYNVQEYLAYMEGIMTCVSELNDKEKNSDWTPHKVELTLWTFYIANKMKPELLDCLKRKHSGDDDTDIEKKKKKS